MSLSPPPDDLTSPPPPPPGPRTPQVVARFSHSQAYLQDLIHPNKDTGLEVANLWLNLAAQARRAADEAGSASAPAAPGGP